MHVSVKTDWRQSLLALLTVTLTGAATADFKVAEVHAHFANESLMLSGNLDLGLSSRVEEALAKGIPIEIVIDIRLKRHRRLMWNENIAAWSLRRRIQYHALSGQYLVMTRDTDLAAADFDVKESFTTLQEGLKQLGVLNDLKLALAPMPTAGEYSLELRAQLDIEALPAPLRPVAYTSLSWRLNSGWSTWKLAP